MRLVAAITGFLACLLVAVDCVEKATGQSTQVLFSASLLWLWWPIAIGWLFNGYCCLQLLWNRE